MALESTGRLRPGDPERLGTYTLTGLLGEGGQGVVYLARSESGVGGAFGGPVAVKLLHADLLGDEAARARFMREFEVARKVASFCTAKVLDADISGDRPYIVSEYVPGPALRRLVEQEGPVTGGALERLAVGTATALVAIHQAGVVHRDFKPGNVLMGPDGPRVIDFGVARAVDAGATVSSRVIGSPAYMAPEQLLGRQQTGPPADIFCWAATIVFAATGRAPYGTDSIPAVMHRVLHEPPDLGATSGPLRALVAECLAKDPRRRPAAQTVLMRLLGQDKAVEPLSERTQVTAGPPALLAAESDLAAAGDPWGMPAERAWGAEPEPVPVPEYPFTDSTKRRSRLVIWGLRGGAVALAGAAVAAATMLLPAAGESDWENRTTPAPQITFPAEQTSPITTRRRPDRSEAATSTPSSIEPTPTPTRTMVKPAPTRRSPRPSPTRRSPRPSPTPTSPSPSATVEPTGTATGS